MRLAALSASARGRERQPNLPSRVTGRLAARYPPRRVAARGGHTLEPLAWHWSHWPAGVRRVATRGGGTLEPLARHWSHWSAGGWCGDRTLPPRETPASSAHVGCLPSIYIYIYVYVYVYIYICSADVRCLTSGLEFEPFLGRQRRIIMMMMRVGCGCRLGGRKAPPPQEVDSPLCQGKPKHRPGGGGVATSEGLWGAADRSRGWHKLRQSSPTVWLRRPRDWWELPRRAGGGPRIAGGLAIPSILSILSTPGAEGPWR